MLLPAYLLATVVCLCCIHRAGCIHRTKHKVDIQDRSKRVYTFGHKLHMLVSLSPVSSMGWRKILCAAQNASISNMFAKSRFCVQQRSLYHEIATNVCLAEKHTYQVPSERKSAAKDIHVVCFIMHLELLTHSWRNWKEYKWARSFAQAVHVLAHNCRLRHQLWFGWRSAKKSRSNFFALAYKLYAIKFKYLFKTENSLPSKA